MKKRDLPVGGGRWLTVVSADDPNGAELVLEPMGFAPARDYQKALFEAGIPATCFGVGNLHALCERLKKQGVVFRTEPTQMGPVSIAVFDDTCGHLIQIAQQ